MTPKLVLTDIEGTTTAIAFVHATLFPFVARALPEFLALHEGVPEVAAVIEQVRAAAPQQAPLETLRGWMAADAKVTPLKALQGIMWRQGYADGRLRGHLWPDVAPALRAWHAAGTRLAVYSSGSEEAQRLLFGFSEAGDLSPLFERFFDTRMGMKREAESYGHIAITLGLPPSDILFLSDVAEELDAATAAGMRGCQLVRPQDGTRATDRHPTAETFAEVARLFALQQPA